ncbi:beta-N-acetylhexosaminidase [Paramicrobacterium chengjingii]|uniref:beta-N-acetylhexosaminidase n=1 Tax=Paramicrobacterium chengjingii TaxID=2769067 RepID=A0ABX6YKZ5_9MICO|nr:beta-N-acetylhexosaminidase [Microbacterium chengjingii]
MLSQTKGPDASTVQYANTVTMVTHKISIIPAPRAVNALPGTYELTTETTVSATPGLADEARSLQRQLRPATGFAIDIVEMGNGTIELALDAGLDAEQYRLAVTENGVALRAGSPRGIQWAIYSFLQLLPPAIHRESCVADTAWMLPRCVIDDAPRFAWRGLMLDVARHFLPKRDVMRVIDLMALHKLNTLHLHLTDDQGWRLEIRAFPRLTTRGGWRSDSQRGHGPNATMAGRPHGGWYTQDDAREIVAYAAERGIDVVPEIEMPGHVQAALAAYPEWGIGDAPDEPWTHWGVSTRLLNLESSTIADVCRILDEVVEIFPSTFIGIGGDEAKKSEWNTDARTRELMRARTVRRRRRAKLVHRADRRAPDVARSAGLWLGRDSRRRPRAGSDSCLVAGSLRCDRRGARRARRRRMPRRRGVPRLSAVRSQ